MCRTCVTWVLASVGNRHNCEINDVTARTDEAADEKDTAGDSFGAATSTRADVSNFFDLLLFSYIVLCIRNIYWKMKPEVYLLREPGQ